MNRITAWLLILMTLLALTGCGGNQTASRRTVVSNSKTVSQLLAPSEEAVAPQGQAAPEGAGKQSLWALSPLRLREPVIQI